MNICNVLEGYNPELVAVAGGYARDLYFGRIPKDLDIAVTGPTAPQDAAGILAKLEALGYVVTITHDNGEYGAGGEERLDCVFKLAHPEYMGIDVLVYAQEIPNLQAALDAHDYNLNQFALTGAGAPYFRGDVFGTLVRLRGSEVSEERRLRMEQIASGVGWKV